MGGRPVGRSHPNVARFSAHLGGLLTILAEVEKARTGLERALGLLEATLGPNHPDVTVVRANLDRVLKELGDRGQCNLEM